MCVLFIVVGLISLVGCVAPPRAVTLSELVTSPELYLNSTVRFSGIVKDSDYREGRYYAGVKNRLYLTITDGEQDIYGYMEGYNKGRILRAVRLAEMAKREEGEVTVTGEVASLDPGTEFKFDRIQYKGKSVLIMEGAFYTYPGDPHYGHRWHYPYGLFRRLRHRGLCD